MTTKAVFVVFVCFVCIGVVENVLGAMQDPSVFYTMIELVCLEGYFIQEHTVVTEDGYILTIYRIPNGNRRPKVQQSKHHYQNLHNGYHPDFGGCVNESLTEIAVGTPVLLSHGIAASSDCWILQGHKRDLAFMLADQGYDVWFSNVRGNFYSRRHKTIQPSDKAFWDFSFHEFGFYDIPSIIDYILQLRNLKKLIYIGHSMGSTMYFVMTTTKPQYNDKILLFVGLTPVAQIRRENYTGVKGAIISTLIFLLQEYLQMGFYEIAPRSDFQCNFARAVCSLGSPFQDLCYDVVFFFAGNHSKLFLRRKLALFVSHSLSGASVKTFLHYEQSLDAPRFQSYDYGSEENFVKYAQEEPMEYDLKKVTAPAVLFYSKKDYVSDYNDVAILKSMLPNVVGDYVNDMFNHLDYLWAYNARDEIYNKILQILDKYRNK